MKAFVCSMAALSAACAYGYGFDKWAVQEDSGKTLDAAPEASAHDAFVDQGSQGPPDVAVTQACTLSLPTGLPTCDACLQASCCAEDDACGSDPDCLDFISCLDACMPLDGGTPDPACQSTCESTYSRGVGELSTLEQCMSAQCPSECSGP